jgi:RNA polymerase sigma-70 factor (ECF subfamily)
VQELAVRDGPARTADFEDLIGPHLEAGYRTALAITRDPYAAQDVVQEAAMKAWRKLGQLHSGVSARPWFLAIVANESRSMRRGRWWSVVRMPHIESGDRNLETDSIDVRRALSGLPPDDRLVLFLHFYLDLPLEEVAVVLGLSAAGAKTRVYRATRKLRPTLEVQP